MVAVQVPAPVPCRGDALRGAWLAFGCCTSASTHLPSETTTPRGTSQPMLSMAGPEPAHSPQSWDSSNTALRNPVAASHVWPLSAWRVTSQ